MALRVDWGHVCTVIVMRLRPRWLRRARGGPAVCDDTVGAESGHRKLRVSGASVGAGCCGVTSVGGTRRKDTSRFEADGRVVTSRDAKSITLVLGSSDVRSPYPRRIAGEAPVVVLKPRDNSIAHSNLNGFQSCDYLPMKSATIAVLHYQQSISIAVKNCSQISELLEDMGVEKRRASC